MNNRFFATLGVIFAILLLLIASGVSSIWAYQKYLAIISPTSQKQIQIETSSGSSPAPRVTEKPQQSDSASSPSEAEPDNAPHAFVWDRTRVMNESRAGLALKKYTEEYIAVIDANIKALEGAVAAKMPGLNVGEARRLIGQYKERKIGFQGELRGFLLQLVTGAAAELPLIKQGVLLEKNTVTWASKEANVTNKLIEPLNAVKVELPPLPEKLELRQSAQQKRASDTVSIPTSKAGGL